MTLNLQSPIDFQNNITLFCITILVITIQMTRNLYVY